MIDCRNCKTIDLYSNYTGKITGTLKSIITHKVNKLWKWDLAHCLHNELGHSARYGFHPTYTDAFKQKRLFKHRNGDVYVMIYCNVNKR